MSRMLLITGLALVMGYGQAFAQTAAPVSPSTAALTAFHNDQLVSVNGRIFRTTSGLKFTAYPSARAAMALWSPLDHLTVCRNGGYFEITNLNRKTKIKALENNN